MLRRLFHLAAAVSLLLCAAAVVLRFRSARVTDMYVLPLPGGKALFVRSNADPWQEGYGRDRWALSTVSSTS